MKEICSFCNNPRDLLLKGPNGHLVCKECIDTFLYIIRTKSNEEKKIIFLPKEFTKEKDV
jgi:hypothetical protein